MLILSCDTSGPLASSALWRDGHLEAEIALRCGKPHATTLMPAVSALLDSCGRTMADIDAFACAIGPGSFTGIRIGVSSVKAMAYAAGRPAVGVSTLEAMAWPYAVCPDLAVCPMIDARNQRVYSGAWLNGQNILAEVNRPVSDFVATLSEMTDLPAAVLMVGHQPDAFYHADGRPVIPGTLRAPAVFAQSRASAVAEIAAARLAREPIAPPQLLMPRYLAVSQAERLLAGNKE